MKGSEPGQPELAKPAPEPPEPRGSDGACLADIPASRGQQFDGLRGSLYLLLAVNAPSAATIST
tara:strand:- start:8741 stop:8932 length:192 start_codon:yes stop_codon:yes gene_type:complete